MTMANAAARRYGQCERKRRYAERWQAAEVVLLAHRDGVEIGQPYRCPHGCDGWHIGHPSKRRRKRRR